MDLQNAGKVKYMIIKHSGMLGENENFQPGSMWLTKSPPTARHESYVLLESVDSPDCRERCEARNINYFTELTQTDWNLLVAIKKLTDRLGVLQTPDWVREGRLMAAGDRVKIQYSAGIPEGTQGVIKYRGLIPGRNGTQFGVEITDLKVRGEGTCDGTFKKRRFFQCEQDCGIFVNLGKLRQHREESFSLSLTEDLGPPLSQVGREDHSLDIHDKVVWLSDVGPEFGTVLWMGVLPDDPLKEAMVGVEFDNAVGSGTGKYRGRQLFQAKKGHASLVPVIGLLKAEEFLDGPGAPGPPDVVPMPDPRGSPPLGQFGLSVGSAVVVHIGVARYGVIRWLGSKPGSTENSPDKLIAGIEMEVPDEKCYTDGTFCNERKFSCGPHRAFFVLLNSCQPDDRPSRAGYDSKSTLPIRQSPLTQGQPSPNNRGEISYENPRGGRREPVEMTDSTGSEGGMYGQSQPRVSFTEDLVGKHRGIQGGQNSCYVDTVLMAMFTFSSVFDILFTGYDQDTKAILDVKQMLHDTIVRPLRDDFYVGLSSLRAFRCALDDLRPDAGFSDSMKDVEEFLDFFLGEILATPKLIRFNTGESAYIYQLLGGAQSGKTMPTVQQLLESSFVESNIKLRTCPPVLLLQLPRFGTEKIYNAIFPNNIIDITSVIEGHPRACSLCSNPASLECVDCFQNSPAKTLADCTFCRPCYEDEHSGESMAHARREISSSIHEGGGGSYTSRRQKYRLMAVVCIATSHYVCFLRCGNSDSSSWIYADSLAHVVDGGGVFSEVWHCPEVGPYLRNSDPGIVENISQFPSILARDAYLCFYEKINL